MLKIALIFLSLLPLLLSCDVGAKVLHSEKSLYRNIQVVETNGQRCMIFAIHAKRPNYQSCFYPADPNQLVFSYTRFILAGFTQLQQPPKSILIIGLGGGTLPMTLEKMYPQTRIDTVEIDAAVLRVATEWFDYRSSKNQNTLIMDGRVYVKRAGLQHRQYDVIILDAFNGDYIPEHMMTLEYFKELKTILAPKGLLMANTFSRNKLYDHESETYRRVFGSFYYLHSDQSGNRIIYANLNQAHQFDDSAEVNRIKLFLEYRGVDFDKFRRLLQNDPDWDTDARPLTDQYSPANLLTH